MTSTMQTEDLRPLAQDAMRAAAALIPFTAGSGRDGHGQPIPNAGATIANALATLEAAGLEAARLREAYRPVGVAA